MSIQDGFKTMHRVLFGFDVGEFVAMGICGKCGRELRFSPVDGNCQSNNTWQVHVKGLAVPDRSEFGVCSGTIYNGAAGITGGWEASLCDLCAMELCRWLKTKER